jgi:hypothetical protein
MRNFKLTVLLLGMILTFSISGLTAPSISNDVLGKSVADDRSFTSDIPLDTTVETYLNTSHNDLVYEVQVTDRGVYLFNWTLKNNGSFTQVGYDVVMRQIRQEYIPQLDRYNPVEDGPTYSSISSLNDGQSTIDDHMFIVTNPGSILFEFGCDFNTDDELFLLNFTVTQEYSSSQASVLTPPESETIVWTEDGTFESARIDIAQDGLYNITIQSYLPYDVTGGFGGGIAFPFDVFYLLNAVHGLYTPDMQVWSILFSIPVGPTTGEGYWEDILLYPLEAGEYYLGGLTSSFEYLNGTYVNATINVERIDTKVLPANGEVDLSFDETDAESMYQWVEYSPAVGYQYDMYFTNPSGSNWSLMAEDYRAAVLMPQIAHITGPTATLTQDYRWVGCSTLSYSQTKLYSELGPLGEGHSKEWLFQGAAQQYLNGELLDGTPPGPGIGYGNLFPTFYLLMVLDNDPTGHSPTFNVTMKSVQSTFTSLPLGVSTHQFNHTAGPYLHGFGLDMLAGYTYEIVCTPTVYTSYGSLYLQVFTDIPVTNRDWAVFDTPRLIKATPYEVAISHMSSRNVNESVSIKFTAVRTGLAYVVVQANDYVGTPDTTEFSMDMTVSAPTTVSLGASNPVTLEDMDFTGYTFDVVEGYVYVFSMSIDYESTEAWAIFFDENGVVPFDIGVADIWAFVQKPDYLEYRNQYTATMTGSVFLALIGGSDITFSITEEDDVAPEVAIIDPSESDVLPIDTIWVNFTVTDDIGLNNLTLTINSTIYVLDTSATHYFWTVTEAGLYTLTLTAEDLYGNIGSDSVTVIVDLHSGSYDQGYGEGNSSGYEDGYSDGSGDGFDEGYDSGFEEGNSTGYLQGYDNGTLVGDSWGWNRGLAVAATAGVGFLVLGLVLGHFITKRRT